MYQQGKQSHIQQALNHLRLFAVNIYFFHSGLLDENPPEWSSRGYSTKIHPIRSYEATRQKSTRMVDSGLLDENPLDNGHTRLLEENPPEWSIRSYLTKIHSLTVIRSYSTKIHLNGRFGLLDENLLEAAHSRLLNENPPG